MVTEFRLFPLLPSTVFWIGLSLLNLSDIKKTRIFSLWLRPHWGLRIALNRGCCYTQKIDAPH